jgi:hypothetical protein
VAIRNRLLDKWIRRNTSIDAALNFTVCIIIKIASDTNEV